MDEYGSPQAPVDEYGSPQAPVDEYGSPHAPVDEYGSPQAPVDEYGSPQAPVDEYGSPQSPAYNQKKSKPETSSGSHVAPDVPLPPSQKPYSFMFDGFPAFPMPILSMFRPEFDTAAFENFQGNILIYILN